MTVELDLTGVAHGGEAIGRAGDLVTFTSLGLPGERVRAEVLERKPRFQRARVVEVLQASEQRVTPPCPIFGTCGGCHWQHASYPEQLRIKTAVLREQLERVARVSAVPLLDAIPSPMEWHYRNRVQVVPVPGTRLVGYRRAHSHDVVPVERCYIADDRINEVIAAAPWRRLSEREWEHVEEIDVRVAPEQAPLVSVLGRGSPPPASRLRYVLAGATFEVPADAFFQVNSGAGELLVGAAIEWLAPEPTDHVVDAYGGVGTFAIPLARRAKKVTSIELPGSAVDAVATNARANGVSSVRAIAASVERGLRSLREPVDMLLVDPPRRGCGPEVTREIARLAPRRVVYVSCEPSTLARDARALLDAGYRLSATRVVDMFPQTYHLESVSLLER
ncbi:MAG TPA: 23S rRNA (uracil(1939)-C(5))-methyltransferase RlmD [Chloroflexota bacterium]|nr:23S rRNA (uracil(1939)-C(5))-methyltransferase RlmD [Chloroflexota bacterium]